MPPSTAHLRASAEALRTIARRLDLDVGPLAEKGGHRTWEGPAATSYRRSATEAEARTARVTAGLRRLAVTLELRADAADLEARREVEEARRAAEGWRAVRDEGPAAPSRPPWRIADALGLDHG